MTGIIGNALARGFTQKQIITFLMRKFPQQAGYIQTAMNMGFTPNQILDYISGGREELTKNEAKAQTEHERTTASEDQTKSNINKSAAALGALGIGAGAFGLSRMGGMAASAMQPNTPPPTGPTSAPLPIQPTPNPMGPIGPMGAVPQPPPPSNPTTPLPAMQPQTPMLGQMQPTAPEPVTEQEPLLPPPDPEMPPAALMLESFGLRERAERMRKEGRSAEMIAAVLNKSLKPEMRKEFNEKLKTGQVKPLIELTREFLAGPSTMGFAKLPPGKEFKFGGLLEESAPPVINPDDYKKKEDVKPLYKGETVFTPTGEIGTVKASTPDGFLVEEGGKGRKYTEDELVRSPLQEKDLADLYDDLIGGIEKESGQEVSRNVSWAGYDPTTNELAYRPHNGRLYIYDDISPEDSEKLTSLLSNRKTTGENFIGAWKEGTKSPIGAAMFQLILKLQKERGGKGNEYKNRFDTIYDALELASKASKEKHAKNKKQAKKPRAT